MAQQAKSDKKAADKKQSSDKAQTQKKVSTAGRRIAEIDGAFVGALYSFADGVDGPFARPVAKYFAEQALILAKRQPADVGDLTYGVEAFAGKVKGKKALAELNKAYRSLTQQLLKGANKDERAATQTGANTRVQEIDSGLTVQLVGKGNQAHLRIDRNKNGGPK